MTSPPRVRRPTLLLRARGNVSYGEAGGGLKAELRRPLWLALPLAAVMVAAGYVTGLLWAGAVLGAAVLLLGAAVQGGRQRRMRAGLIGEQAAAHALRRLPDAVIFNDVMLGGENADSVVVSRQGIYSIEVKHWAGVVADRQGVRTSRGGRTEDKPQVLAQATRQSSKLARLTRHWVTPVVVFTVPGSQLKVRELNGVTLCTLPELCGTVTRLRRQPLSPLTARQMAQVIATLRQSGDL